LPIQIHGTILIWAGALNLFEQSVTHRTTIRYPSIRALFVACTAMGAISYGRWYLLSAPLGMSQPSTFVRELLGWLTCYYPWVLLAPAVFTLEERFPLERNEWLRSLRCLAPASVAFAYLASELSQGLNLLLLLAFREPLLATKRWWLPAAPDLLLQVGIYGTALATAYLVRKANELRQKEKLAAKLALENAELEGSLRQAELDNLRMRLNPHFLFNSLQNISILAQQDAKMASQMLARLGDLLRIALRRDCSQEATLEAEIALTKAYVAIEEMRFPDRLSVLFHVGAETERGLVPTFLLQPLVENAIKHGLGTFEQHGLITIESARAGSSLIVSVRDNGAGVSSDKIEELKVGIGLGSTIERLQRVYPGQHQFSIRPLPEGGTEVRVVLPFRTKELSADAFYAESSSIDCR
jgi:two-component system, LytTR family, sensor kinase